ncbi:protein DNA-DAMAGE INDUCIBLE 1-like isoform X2 [Camellia sinensis]|uniref:protein DNA-DAMAGE INDUCIBLE 1-like isoform X2 n=1 Tax=Camellia sinensis TaxID=4442 RepID=UPI0010357CC8|nr:protein DNA-DAMAGE INDUCIBLE 1-like isoform X2 [Camellia sinensis]
MHNIASKSNRRDYLSGALLKVEAQVSNQQQQLFYNGKEMRNAEKLSGLGVNDVMIVSHASSFRLRKWDQVQLPYPCHFPDCWVFLHP